MLIEPTGDINRYRRQAHIEYRDEHGGFQSIEEIMNVSGIGEKTFESIKDQISVR